MFFWHSMITLLKFVRLFFCVAVASGFFSCTRNSKSIPKSAYVLGCLNGEWVGTWSWNKSRSTTLKISGLDVTFVDFPVLDFDSLNLIQISSKGVAEPVQNYGPSNRPCLLVSPKDKTFCSLYLTSDKNGVISLEYNVQSSLNRTITFARSH
jgi:hypothetical protein